MLIVNCSKILVGMQKEFATMVVFFGSLLLNKYVHFSACTVQLTPTSSDFAHFSLIFLDRMAARNSTSKLAIWADIATRFQKMAAARNG